MKAAGAGGKAMAAKRPILRVENQKLWVSGQPFPLGAYIFEREIGSGANGFVFKAQSALLKRDEAVKLWLPRAGDRRNKVHQGMLEAQKQASVLHSQVIQIFHADIMDGIFFSTMQFLDAPNLRTWCKSTAATMIHRWAVATNYLTLIKETSKPDLFHGDPHAGNVLISSELRPWLCDYGTSYYSSRDKSWQRHWTIVDEVMRLLFAPFITFSECRRRHPEIVPADSADSMVRAYEAIIFQMGLEVFKERDKTKLLTPEQRLRLMYPTG